nr:hypothetical protein GCM10025732_30740 [Glycomyces mayteni]
MREAGELGEAAMGVEEGLAVVGRGADEEFVRSGGLDQVGEERGHLVRGAVDRARQRLFEVLGLAAGLLGGSDLDCGSQRRELAFGAGQRGRPVLGKEQVLGRLPGLGDGDALRHDDVRLGPPCGGPEVAPVGVDLGAGRLESFGRCDDQAYTVPGGVLPARAHREDEGVGAQPFTGPGVHARVGVLLAGEVAEEFGQELVEVVGLVQVVAERGSYGRDEAEGASEAHVDAVFEERGEDAELLGDHQRAVVGQHDAAGADPDPRGRCGDGRRQDGGRRTGDAGHAVVLGHPVAVKAQFLGLLGIGDDVAQGFRGVSPSTITARSSSESRRGCGVLIHRATSARARLFRDLRRACPASPAPRSGRLPYRAHFCTY